MFRRPLTAVLAAIALGPLAGAAGAQEETDSAKSVRLFQSIKWQEAM